MFRLQNNTPPIYTEGSRDFQLFCRLYDCVNNAVRFDINTITNILDPLKANDRILELMCTKIGFFTKYDFDADVLRAILSTFPYIIKYKGSIKGIELAVSTILKLEGNNLPPKILIDNTEHIINIYISTSIFNTNALDELLDYVIPIGYTYSVQEYGDYKSTISLDTNIVVDSLLSPIISTSQVLGSDRQTSDFTTRMEQKYIGTAEVSEVVGSSNYMTVVDGSGNTTYTAGRDDVDTSDISKVKTVKLSNSDTYNTVLIKTDTNPKGDS